MLTRLKRTLLAFATTVAAYFLYALLIVPMIEPTLKKGPRAEALPRPPSRARKLQHLFPPGSWELDRPKVFETDEGMLLFDDYQPLPDGNLRFTRCTVIGYVEQTAKGASATNTVSRRPVMLRADEGALLKFDRPLDVLRGQFGRLKGGRLLGAVTITSPPSNPSQDDAIRIATRNVQLDSHRIWTPHEVDFQYGMNTGHGRDLNIYLAPSSKSSDEQPGLGIGGIRLL
jgi:hypothetical protein